MSGIHETASNIDTGRGISLNLLLAISYQENFEDIKRGNKKSECMSDYCLTPMNNFVSYIKPQLKIFLFPLTRPTIWKWVGR
jgi:hypothetical protein